jgi:hypothetical protein
MDLWSLLNQVDDDFSDLDAKFMAVILGEMDERM